MRSLSNNSSNGNDDNIGGGNDVGNNYGGDDDRIVLTATSGITATTSTTRITVGQQVGFVFLAFGFLILAYKTTKVVWSRSEFIHRRSSSNGSAAAAVYIMILPAISILLGLECCLFLLHSILPIDSDHDDEQEVSSSRRHIISSTLFILESLVAPGLFLATFAITFFAYRIRGMPFCFVRRRRNMTTSAAVATAAISKRKTHSRTNDDQELEDSLNYHIADAAHTTSAGACGANGDYYHDEQANDGFTTTRGGGGGRATTTAVSTTQSFEEPLVQPRVLVIGMQVVAVMLAVVSILINVKVVSDDSTGSLSDLAGRTGWSSVFNADASSDGAIDTIHIVIALLPMGLTCIFCTYFAILLWRYGNELSMTIYTSSCNPWMAPLLAVSAMIAGQFFGPSLFPLMSNLGIFVYLVSLLCVLLEIRRDMEQAVDDLGAFLCAVWGEKSFETTPSIA